MSQVMVTNGQGQSSFPVGGGTSVVYAYKSGSTVYHDYNSCQAKSTGAAQITLGILLFLINVIMLCIGIHDSSVFGPRIWGGIVFIMSGSFGVVAANRKTKCFVITYMVLSVVAAVLIIPVIILSASILSFAAINCHEKYLNYGCTPGRDAIVFLHALMLSLAVLEAAAAIWGSALFCKAALCCSTTNTTSTPVKFLAANSNHVIVIGETGKPAGDLNKAEERKEGKELCAYESLRESQMNEGIDYQRLLD